MKSPAKDVPVQDIQEIPNQQSNTIDSEKNLAQEEPKTQELEEGQEPEPEKKQIIIGAGGLRAFLMKVDDTPKVRMGSVRRSNKLLYGTTGSKRDVFKKIILDLKAFYLDFETNQNESKLFKVFQELPEAATILHRISILHKCGKINI